MRNYKYLTVLTAMLSLLSGSCSDEKKEETSTQGPTVDVTFTTNVLTRAVVTELKEGDEMNLFAKEYNTLSSNDMQKNIKAVYNNGIWRSTPPIQLVNGQKTFLYAFYPYNTTNIDPTSIPVNMKSQTDYLYSGKGVPVTYTTPKGNLTMKHALSMLSFNIQKTGYGKEGKLQEISIKGDNIFTEGVLNIETGIIEGTKAEEYKFNTAFTILADGWTAELPQLFCLPFESKGNDVNVTMKIDNISYSFNIPKIIIESGIKYIFRLALTPEGLTIFADQTKQISLNIDEDTMPDTGEYGVVKIAHTNTYMVTPLFEGTKTIKGNIFWGDGKHDEYVNNASHTYNNTDNYSITIETWGANSISLSNIKGISEINLSDF